MQDWQCDSPDSESSFELASELGRAIGEPGLVIGLVGPLGAGKTVFVKGLAEGLGVDARLVSSPTFVIAQQFPLLDGPRVLHHLDFYRLESVEELDSIGFDDMFARGCVLAVEWADRFPGALGPEWLEVEIEGPSIGRHPGGEREEGWEEAVQPPRRIRVRAHGPEARRVCADWAARVDRLGLVRRTASGGEEDAARSRSVARDGATRTLAVLLLAAGVAAFAARDGADPLPLCRQPTVLASDAWGAARIDCDGDPGAPSADAGLGGLLLGHPIDPNRASAAVLEALPGIGPARAQAILSERERAPFESLAALERASGIGPKLRRQLEPWMRVERAPQAIRGNEISDDGMMVGGIPVDGMTGAGTHDGGTRRDG
jgi:tRNA threonylcarbamoyladenosine biosynthesis protein TsaE